MLVKYRHRKVMVPVGDDDGDVDGRPAGRMLGRLAARRATERLHIQGEGTRHTPLCHLPWRVKAPHSMRGSGAIGLGLRHVHHVHAAVSSPSAL